MFTSPPRTLTYTPADVARLTGLSEPTIRGQIARGRLPSFRLGRRILLPAAEVEAALVQLRRAFPQSP